MQYLDARRLRREGPASAANVKAASDKVQVEAKAKGPCVLDAVPPGYFLHAYDDCGIPARQPHVLMLDSYCWTFNTSDTDADVKIAVRRVQLQVGQPALRRSRSPARLTSWP